MDSANDVDARLMGLENQVNAISTILVTLGTASSNSSDAVKTTAEATKTNAEATVALANAIISILGRLDALAASDLQIIESLQEIVQELIDLQWQKAEDTGDSAEIIRLQGEIEKLRNRRGQTRELIKDGGTILAAVAKIATMLT